MDKRLVLDVGNCGPDHASIRRMLQREFEVEVLQTHGLDDTLDVLRSKQISLVLINRKLDQDYSDGTEILKQIKLDPGLAALPVMIVTNYEEHQQAAMQLGAERGFGKLSMNDLQTKERLSQFLAS